MSKRWIRLTAILAILILAGGAYLIYRDGKTPAAAGASLSSEIVLPAAGFARAEEPRAFTFPADHGPHPEFQTEWWYFTGNLVDTAGGRYGYQLTFFRRALAAPQNIPERTSDWGTSQVYMAHFAVSDVPGNKFQSYERLQRGSAGLAGAEGEPLFKVWLEDWSVDQQLDGSIHLKAEQEGIDLDLTMTEGKPPVLQGNEGYSQKGPQAGNASYYYSLTRLESHGNLTLRGEKPLVVSGLSWMDHEFSTSALSHGQIGWDWFALQLSDGSDLMVFSIRQADGTADPYSGGSYVKADGSKITLSREDFKITPLDNWTSPYSGARYPSGWRVEVPGEGILVEITPLLRDQENRLTFTYWEGAVRITGSRDGKAIDGYGYVELTGYAASMQGEF